jgi:uncharacterized membrane protein (DUF485 family)
MIGEALLYMANRASGGAVDSVARKASWIGFAVFLLLAGCIFGLVAAFWWLTTTLSPITAGIIVAAGCFALGFICMIMPKFLERLEKRAAKPAEPVADTVNAVKEEVSEAVDYFGPLRVVASAFMLGLGLARTVKR